MRACARGSLLFATKTGARHPTGSTARCPRSGRAGARLLIVGLAPGLNGANRTGRPFTGDYAGDLLYATLLDFGFARGRYEARPDDGLQLVDCIISNAVRCVPPQNKPTPAEIAHVPRLPAGAHRSAAQCVGDRGAGAHRARQHADGARLAQGAISFRARRAPRAASRACTSSTASIARATTPTRAV